MIYNKLKLLHLASSKTSSRKPVTQNLQYQHLPNHTQTPLTMLPLLPLWKHQQLNFPNSILTWPTPNFGRLIQTCMFSVQSLTSLAIRFMLSYTVFFDDHVRSSLGNTFTDFFTLTEDQLLTIPHVSN